MSKKIMGVLGILVIIFIIVTVFVVGSRKDTFDLEKINWELTTDQLAKEVGEELVLGSYTRLYQGVKKVTDSDTEVKYTFSESKKLESLNIVIRDNEEKNEKTVNKIKAMSEKIEGKDNEAGAEFYTLLLNDSQIKLIYAESYILIEVKQDKTGEIGKAVFLIDDIDWETSRDGLKKQMGLPRHENEEALGYIYDGIDDISDEETEVIYYFDNNDNMVMIFLEIKYDNDSLKKTLDYFDISPENSVKTEDETYWEVQTSNAKIIVAHETNDEMLKIAMGRSGN